MKLVVQEIEEIELTDPQGLCNPRVPQIPSPMQPSGQPPIPAGINPQILPAIPSGWPTTSIPRTGDVAMPPRPSIFTRHVDPNDRTKWGVGGPMIQQAGNPDPDKFEKNWQASMNGAEGQEDGNGNNH